MTYAKKRTILDPENAPENMTKLVHDMYNVGLLRIECFGYRRVGFDEALNAALMQYGTWSRDRKPQDTSGALPAVTNGQSQKQEQKGQRRPAQTGSDNGAKSKAKTQKKA